MLLAYILTSAINARASFNLESKAYTYYSNYIKYLPHSYNANGTWSLFFQYLGFAILFFSIIDWLNCAKSNHSNNLKIINERIKKILILITINGGLVALIGLLQKIYYANFDIGKLLFLIEPDINKANVAQFGPFAYRSNAATFFNIIWPISLGWILKYNNFILSINNGKPRESSTLILIPFIVLMIYSSFATLSRGGALIAIGLILIICILMLFKSRSQIHSVIVICTILIPIVIIYFLGWKGIESRLTNIFIDNGSHRFLIYENAITILKEYVLSGYYPSPFGSGPNTFEAIYFFEVSPSINEWESWCHNDYLEILITFGIPGSVIISLIAIYILVLIYINFIYYYDIIFIFVLISLVGLFTHAFVDFPLQVHSIIILKILGFAILLTKK